MTETEGSWEDISPPEPLPGSSAGFPQDVRQADNAAASRERAHTFHSHSWSPLRFCIYRCAYHTVFSAVLSTLSINKRGGSVLPMPPSPQDHLACFLSQSSSSDKSGAIWTWGKGKKSCLGVVPLRTAEKWHPARWPPPRPERCPHSIAPGRPRLPIVP